MHDYIENITIKWVTNKRPTVEHRELYPALCNDLHGQRF